MDFKIPWDKLILLVIAVSAVLVAWFMVIVPRWHVVIKNKVEAANYCEINSDCVIDYFDSFTCGSFVNKNESVNNIYKEIKLYRMLSMDYSGCGGWALVSACKNKKCISIVN